MHTWRPDLEDLDLLVLVARLGSIGAAADHRQMSQPSVSRRLAALERSLKVELLVRSRRGSSLTPAGHSVVGWAEGLLAVADEFTQSIGMLRRTRSASVNAAASLTIAEHLAPFWVSRLRTEQPEINVSLLVQNSAQVVSSVSAGLVEIGFIESPSIQESLRRRKVAADRLVVAVASSHPWAAADKHVSVEELAQGTLLVREPGSGTRDTLDHALARVGSVLGNPMVMGSNTALRSAAAAGVAPVVLSELAVAADVLAGQLVEVLVTGLDLGRPLTAVWRHDAPPSGGAAALLRIARKAGTDV